MNNDKACFLLLDFETGGLLPCFTPKELYWGDGYGREIYPAKYGSPILSFGAILLDENLNLLGFDYGLVKPAMYDSKAAQLNCYKEAFGVNNLDPAICQNKGMPENEMLDKLEALCKLAGDSPIILTGSNPEFDRGFWHEAALHNGRIIPKAVGHRSLDTYELNFRYLYTSHHFHKNGVRFARDNSSLPKFMKMLGLPHKAHDAMGDCVAVWTCLRLHLNGDSIDAIASTGIPNNWIRSSDK